MNTAQTKAKRKSPTRTVRHVNVRRITNPFEPLKAAETDRWVWKKSRTLDAYLPVGLAEDHVVSVNGAIVEPDKFRKTTLKPEDYVVLCPIPRGQGGKGIFRVIAMIAVAVAAAYTGGAAAAAYGATAGSALGVSAATGAMLVNAAVSVAVTVAGSLLVNAILPPVTATNTGSSLANSASYGADGAKNTSNEGVAVPVVYGNYRMAGNIIGLYTELNTSGSDASNNGNNQILYMLINAGEGPIASISDVLINDRAADEYQDVTLQQRLGAGAQSEIDWFSKVITPVNHNIMLPSDGTPLTFQTVEECEQFRVDFVCPSGLYSVDSSSGSVKSNTVAISAQYRQVGATDWLPLGPTTTTYREVDITPTVNGTLNPFDYDDTLIITGLSIVYPDGGTVLNSDVAAVKAKYQQFVGQPVKNWPVSGGGMARMAFASTSVEGDITITDNLRAAVRRSYTSPQVALAKYEIQLARNVNYSIQTVNSYTNQVNSTFPTDTSDMAESDTYVTDINEITFDGVAYNHTALLAVRVQMDDQLSSVPTVTFMHGGKLVNTITRIDGVETVATVSTTNPAWIWYDMATNQVYGAAIDPARIDLDSVIAWADYCTQEGLAWNGPLDQIQNFWDASALVLRVGHAQVMQMGTRFYVTTEAPADPVMLFGMGNIVKDSFKMTWLGMKDRATEVDVTYFDKTDYNKAKTVKVQDSTLALNASTQNVSSITIYGIDDIQTAYKEGAFALNLNRYLTQSVEFEAPVEAIACMPGDVVLVQHDMPDWAASGRLDAGSTASTLVLDKMVTMQAGTVYKALLLTDSVVRQTGRIQAVIGNFIQIVGGAYQSDRVLRIRASNGAEAAITTVSSDGVYVDDATGFVSGATITLYDTDVVTECDVATVAGTTNTIQLQSPLSYTPTQFTNYVFGESSLVKKPFRVKSITLGSSDFNRTINALEYNPAVYDLSSYDGVLGTLTPPLLDPSQAAIGEVQDLTIYEESYVSGTNILNNVRASWSLPIVGSYAGADVYVQINGGAFKLAASVPSAPTYVIEGANTGDLVAVKVVAYDLWNKRASYDGAPTASHKVVGQPGTLTVAAVTGVDYIWSGRDCKLFWTYNSVTGSFEFGSEPNGADGGSLDPHFLDYEIQVYDENGKLLRTEHTTDNGYDYTYEKNFADGLHRRLTFHIMVRDIFNNKGNPAVLDCYNPPPQIVSINDNPAYDRVQIDFTTTGDPDYAGAMIYLAWSGDIDPNVSHENASQLAYDGPDLSVLLTGLMFNSDYQFMIVPYDAFGKSDLIPSAAFTFHTPYMDVNAIADGVLKDSQLIPELQTRIDLIDAPDSIVGSVNQRLAASAASTLASATLADQGVTAALNAALTTAITNEANTRKSATGSLSSQISTVSANTDANGAAVRSEATARSDADSALGTRIDSVVATNATNTAAINSEANTRANADGALSTRIDSVVASNSTNAAAIQSEQTARISADGALGTRIDTVSASTASNAAAIQTETTARTNADTALGSRIDVVAASNGTNTAAIQTEQTARIAADSAISSRIDTVVASYGNDPTNLVANPVGANGTTGWSAVTVVAKTNSDVPVSAPAANVFKQNTRDNFFSGRTVDVSPGQQHYVEVSAATPVSGAQQFAVGLKLMTASGSTTYVTASTLAATSTWTRVAGYVTIPAGYTQAQLWTQINITGTSDASRWYFTDAEWRPASLTQPVQAAVTTETNARASADSALGSRIDTLTATVNSNNTTQTAAIQNEASVRASADSANASSISTLQTTVGGHTTSIQAQQSSINGLSAQYTVKIDNNGYVAGYGLASTSVNGQVTSEFAVRTDTFSVNLPGYPGVHPFTIGAVNGVPQVIISSALIGDASINTAKIGDAQITAAKIGSAQIQTAHIGVAQVDTLRIGLHAVTTLVMFGPFSSNQTPVYASSGGDLLVMISGNVGSPAHGDTPESAGGAVVTINGQQLSIVGTSGNMVTNFVKMSPPAASLPVQVQLSTASNVSVAVFEVMR
ncbi:phage tail protein [Paraburkholderia sp.]|uniref:phage tail protein n=1 Tax=Paraburkholderia sp. TaxID=1926495 RepID=UPI0039E5A2CD